MNEKNEKPTSELSMEELENVAGGVHTNELEEAAPSSTLTAPPTPTPTHPLPPPIKI